MTFGCPDLELRTRFVSRHRSLLRLKARCPAILLAWSRCWFLITYRDTRLYAPGFVHQSVGPPLVSTTTVPPNTVPKLSLLLIRCYKLSPSSFRSPRLHSRNTLQSGCPNGLHQVVMIRLQLIDMYKTVWITTHQSITGNLNKVEEIAEALLVLL